MTTFDIHTMYFCNRKQERNNAMETEPTKKSKKKLDILSALDAIVDAAKDSKLSDEFYKKCSRYIKYVSSKLDITKEQCVFLSVFMEKSNDSKIYINEVADYLGCRTTHILRYSKEIDSLIERDYIRRGKYKDRVSYHVSSAVIDAFKNDQPIPTRNIENLNCADFFNRIAEIFDMVDDGEMDRETAETRIQELMEFNQHLSFIEKVSQYKLDEVELLVLLIFCHRFIEENDDRVMSYDMEFMFDKSFLRHIMADLTTGRSHLQDKKLVEWSSDGDMADKEHFRLTMNAKRELLDELNLPSLSENRLTRGIIRATDIKPHNLFYSKEITHSIDDLEKLLDDKNYQDIHTRLLEQGFRSGFTCLFYGAPGTGKTETVLQLAHRTGRDILQVNFAEIKSCWVGESEKNIKALFDSYRQKVKTSLITPILLFNEADAIIGKRQEGAERAVDKMENSIQNIILQEMETLDGILVATTNLAQNMDKAFERRFLYKIRFDKPTVEARTAIWKEMLPALDIADAEKLAERYDFSGGQIENIARHYAIDAIIHGNAVPTAENLTAHCDSERIEQNTSNKRIGFSF